MIKKIRLIYEGGYPHKLGGVSKWVENHIKNSNFEFELVYLTSTKREIIKLKKMNFKLPSQVKSISYIPLFHNPTRKYFFKENLKNLEEIINCVYTGGCLIDVLEYVDIEKAHSFLIYDKSVWNKLLQYYYSFYSECPFYEFFYIWKNRINAYFNLKKTSLLMSDDCLNHSLSTGYSSLFCLTMKQARSTNFLLCMHGSYLEENLFEMKRKNINESILKSWSSFFSKLEVLSLRQSLKVLVVSKRLVLYLKKYSYLNGKLYFLPNAVNVIEKKSRTLSFKAAFIGRVTPLKNIETLISALSLLDQKLKENWSFFIIGPASDPLYLEQLISKVNQHDLNDFIFFKPEVNNHNIYNDIDFLILPSLREEMPYVLLEAGINNVGIISSDVGDCADLLERGERGLLFHHDDEVMLKRHIEVMCSDDGVREEMASKMYNYVRTFHDLDVHSKKIDRIYGELF